jgi:hypothetical protein
VHRPDAAAHYECARPCPGPPALSGLSGDDLQKQLWIDVPFIPMGEYWQATAYRKDLTDVLPGCFAVFYGVRRA